jgi:hypothetical protein
MVTSAEDRPGGQFLNDHNFVKISAMLRFLEEGYIADPIKEVKGESIVREMRYDSPLIRGIRLHRRGGISWVLGLRGQPKC